MENKDEFCVQTENESDIQFSDLFDLKDIQHIQDLFSNATGVASIITHPDGAPITHPSNFCRLCNDIIRKTEKGLANCYRSDAILGRLSISDATVQPCMSGGLYDAGASITVGGKHIANWLIGQVRNENIEVQQMIEYAGEIGANREAFMKALAEVPVMSLDQFTKVSKMLFAFAKELSEKAYSNLQLKKQIAERDKATAMLKESEENFLSEKYILHENLKRSEEFLRETQKIARLGAYTLNIDSDNWISSEILDDIFGIDSGYDKSVQGWASIVHPEWRQMMVDYFTNEVLGNHCKFDKEYMIIRQNSKEERWVYGLGKVTYNDANQPVKMIGTIQDITDRKRVEKTLQNERLLLRTLIDNIPDSIYSKDLACRKTLVNIAEVGFMGAKSEAEVLGKDDFEFYPKELAEKFFADDQLVIQTGKPVINREEYIIDENGQKRWLLSSKLPLRNKDSEIIGLVGIGRDITERKQAEEKLIIAKEKAESGDRLKTAFMNNISHEIRTPLNGILGFGNLMGDPNISQDERDGYFEIVKISSDRLMNTVTDYMDISLIASGNQEVHKKLIAPCDILNEIYDMFLQSCQTKKLKLSIHTPTMAGKLHINTDPKLLHKALRHFVDNAIKFTAQGYVTFGFEENGDELKFFVTDTGVGISPEAQTTIFDKFMQENVSMTRNHEGSGLGLSIAKGIVELLGGRIWLESVKGKGSSFFFTIK
ncbi:MAG: PocR ligand-binding domain-containing protein [Bacteroidetes bacterium]|nr:PocR ligand-binding domain-containing protein [Bacteroidota bacterium]